MEFNLLPWRLKRRLKCYQELIGLILVPIVITLYFLVKSYYINEVHLQVLKVKLNSLSKQKQQLDYQLNTLAKHKLKSEFGQNPVLTSTVFEQQQALLNLMVYIGAILPDEVKISHWSLANNELQWQGESINQNQIMSLLNRLRAVNILTEVHIEQLHQSAADKATTFTVVAKLNDVDRYH